MADETFEDYVDRWDAKKADIAGILAAMEQALLPFKERLKALTDEEMAMRKAIEQSVATALGDSLKDGVNHFTLADGRKLKYTRSVKREIVDAEIVNARAAFVALNTPQPVAFDALLRVKNELAKAEWNKLDDDAKKAVSRMVSTKLNAPTVELV